MQLTSGKEYIQSSIVFRSRTSHDEHSVGVKLQFFRVLPERSPCVFACQVRWVTRGWDVSQHGLDELRRLVLLGLDELSLKPIHYLGGIWEARFVVLVPVILHPHE